MENLGLKGCMKKYKGAALRFKCNRLLYELKLAWQRAWRGYDNRDVWDLSSMLKQRLIATLEDYKKNRHGLWWCPEVYDWTKVAKYDEQWDRFVFSEEQMDAILDTLIFHLRMSNADYVEKKLYGNNVYDDGYDFDSCRNYQKIAKIRKQNQDAAVRLLGLLMDDLWD